MDIESVRVRRLGLADWRRFRRIRLSALVEAPYAFGATRASPGRCGPAPTRAGGPSRPPAPRT
ncbi:hypothetical protein ACWEKT_29405, partial [Nocardia takedensis]